MKLKKIVMTIAIAAGMLLSTTACGDFSSSEKETILARLDEAGITVPEGSPTRVFGGRNVFWDKGEARYGVCAIEAIWLVDKNVHILFRWKGEELVNPIDAKLREHPETKDCK